MISKLKTHSTPPPKSKQFPAAPETISSRPKTFIQPPTEVTIPPPEPATSRPTYPSIQPPGKLIPVAVPEAAISSILKNERLPPA